MIVRLLAGVTIGAALGALMGYVGSCTSGACPLTANPLRGGVMGALLGALFALSMAKPWRG